jgi:hypothetical protein
MALQAGVMNLPGVGIPLAESSHSPSKVLCLTEVPYIFFLVCDFIFFFTSITLTLTTTITLYLKNGGEEEEINRSPECSEGKLVSIAL